MNRARFYKEDIEFLYEQNNNLNESNSIFSIYPPEGTEEISRMEKDRTKLIQGSITAMKEVMKVFDIQVFYYHEVLCPFNKLGVIPKISV